ncbi:MAG: DUF1893 domain-containing protein [Ruminococcus sp.]|nr:DUF1893 domain-containing protein [Candidatus Copronaster equi]
MTERAKELFEENGATFAAVSPQGEYISLKRGVAPIIDKYDEDSGFFNDACVVDKVIGKAAAMLLVRYGVKEIHTNLISNGALEFLKDKNIKLTYNTKTEYIINRTKTDICPMEKCVMDVSDEAMGEILIREKLLEMKTK